MVGPTSHFLNVERSVTGRAWIDRLDSAGQRLSAAMVQQHELNDVLARMLAARGVGLDEVTSYLNPTLRDMMPDPSTLQDMDLAASLLADAIVAGQRIAIFGDYDVDGATSSALVSRFLGHFRVPHEIYIPDRVFEGYGPNTQAISGLRQAGADLLLTLDCGSTSHEAISHAKSLGMKVVVVDHHQIDDTLPDADALVNPNRPDDLSKLGHLSAVGVTFMTLVAVNRELRQRGDNSGPDLMRMLDLVALGTVCDVVPLKTLNRAFVVRGLEQHQRAGNKGMRALALAARLSGPLNTYALGYMIGPRINAGGRISDASLGARLLASDQDDEVYAIAARLDELNAERQAIEAEAVSEAIAVAEAEIAHGEGPSVLVQSSEHWHPGVVGLVAARLKERFNRPAFAIAMRPDGTGVGSGRSIPGVDLGTAVLAAANQGLVIKGGGHAMAAGVTLEQGQIAGFRAHLAERLGGDVAKARHVRELQIDAAITARTATTEFVNTINLAGPFGAGNASPLFVLPAHTVKSAQIVGKGGHIRATLASGDRGTIEAIAFRAAETELGQFLMSRIGGDPLHICGALNINHWQGRERVQLRVEDAAPLPRY